MAWRDIKRKMRRDVHTTMGVPAYFLAGRMATPISITIRGPHTKRDVPEGALPGRNMGYAEIQDIQPRLIFDRAELAAKSITLVTNALISIEVGEGYRIANVLPVDDQWVAAEVVLLNDQDANGLPVPGGV